MEELILKLKETQELIDKTLMEIGLKYSHYTIIKDKSLIEKINEKVDLFQKLEEQLQIIENKIREQKN
uniref:hypothetical protein n=1 Tax=Fulvivirga sp. TaxID=1931237 RepID=UPI00404A7C63